MLKIGEFSRVGKVSIKTLRYYDSIGLLTPDSIDSVSGYRYYTAAKLKDLMDIKNLKQLGLSLDTIRTLIVEQVPAEERMDIFLKQQEKIAVEVQAANERALRIEQYIQHVAKEQTMESVRIETLPKVTVASQQLVIPEYSALFSVAPAMGKIMEKQGAVCSKPAYCFNIYHDEEYRSTDIDLEICEAVETACEDGDGIIYKVIESVPTAAVIAHRGDYETLTNSYQILFQWIEENGYRVSDKARESYIDGIWNCESSTDWLTEIQIPVEKI